MIPFWKPFVYAMPVALAALLLACGEDATTPPDTPEDPDPGLAACDWVSLSTSSSIPLEGVEVGVVPDSFATPVWAEIRVAGDTTAAYTWLDPDTTGLATMPGPIHPLGDPDGGPVELTVTDGNHVCAPVDFTIEPLPVAPGTFAALVDSLETMLELQSEILGITVQELATASFDTLAEERFPLAITQAVISHPDNPNSLAAIAAGTSDVIGELDPTMADRLLARTGFPEALAGHLSQLHAIVDSLPSTAAATSVDGAVIGADASNPFSYNCIGITTAFELDFCMKQAVAAANMLTGATGKLLGDMGTATGVAGLVPEPTVRAASAILGAGTWAAQQYFSGQAGLLPSQLGDLTFELTKASFKEDEPGPGQWQEAMISASSTGWGVDKAVLEAIAQAAGLIGPFQELANRFEGTSLSVDDLLSFVLGDRVGAAIDATDNVGSDLIEFPPETFGPVPVGEAAWTESETDAFGIIALTDRTTYEPRKVGVGYVIVQNVEGTFGDQTARTQKPVEVEQLQVSISPTRERADAGQVIAFDATVKNAHSPEALEVEAKLGQIINVTYEGEGLHTIEYSAPEQTTFRDFITATHTATTGARGHSSDARVAQADIFSKAEVIVDPPTTCVDPDSTATFTAEVIGFEDQSVTWTVVNGTGDIDEGGTFTPDQPGSVTIRATSTADTTIFADAYVTVGGCQCWWSVSVTGLPAYGSANMDDGWQIEFITVNGELASIVAAGGTTSGAVANFGVAVPEEGTVPLAAGSIETEALGQYGNPATPTNWTTNDTTGLAITELTQASTGLMEGSAFGTVRISPYPFTAEVTYLGVFQASFRITPEVALGTGVVFHRCGGPE